MTKLKMMQRKFISHRKLKPRKTRGKTRGDGSLVSCPNQFSPHFINGRSAKADRCGNYTGTIKLLTERPMCNSCANVVTQFTAKYKNIVIEVVDNGHKLYVK